MPLIKPKGITANTPWVLEVIATYIRGKYPMDMMDFGCYSYRRFVNVGDEKR